MPAQNEVSLLPDLVRTLTIAWKNLGAYPPGHPALAGAIESIHQKLAPLTQTTGELVLGISKDALLFGELKFDFTHAQKFAEALYIRDVALVRFERGVKSWELEFFLLLLVAEPNRAHRPFWDEMKEAGLEHIQVQPVDYSAVRATEDLDQAPPPISEPGSLWDAILKALLSGQQLSANGERLRSDSSAAAEIALILAEYLKTSPAEEASSQSSFTDGDDSSPRVLMNTATIGGAGQTISRRMKSVRPAAASASTAVVAAVSSYLSKGDSNAKRVAAHQVAELLRVLPAEMRDAVLGGAVRALASHENAGPALQALCNSQPGDAILVALRRVKSEGIGLSEHAMRLAQALSAVTRSAVSQPQDPEVESMAMELQTLMRDEDVDRFNPEDHEQLLGEISLQLPNSGPQTEFSPKELNIRLDTIAEGVVTEALGASLLGLVESHGSELPLDGPLRRLEKVFLFYLRTSQLEQAISLTETLNQLARRLPPKSAQQESLQAFFGKLVSQETITSLLEHQVQRPDEQTSPLLRKLIESLGAAASKNFLIALAEEENRSRRRKLFDLLTSLGPLVVPGARKLLTDDRWYVVRNMILLLRSVQDRTSVGDIRHCAYHPDLRVRLEAIKSLLVFDPEVPTGLLHKAIHDPDPKMAEAAVVLVGNYGIKEGKEPLLKILKKWDPWGTHRSLRIKSLRALSELADAAVLPRLDHFFHEGLVSMVAKEERRAAYKYLEAYPPAERRPIVERGLRSRDPEIRVICAKISDGEKEKE